MANNGSIIRNCDVHNKHENHLFSFAHFDNERIDKSLLMLTKVLPLIVLPTLTVKELTRTYLKLTKAFLYFYLFSLAHFDGERSRGGELSSQAAGQQHRGEENEAEHSE